jgi:beta-1,4-mannosyltransferase
MDLPMKIVDMYGCSLPVCAVNYDWYPHERFKVNTINSLAELVTPNHTGLLFEDAKTLAGQFKARHQLK